MRILCLLSGSRGHIDFGGDGYLRLAGQLKENGALVHWFASGEDHVKKLRSVVADVTPFPAIDALNTRRLIRVTEANGAVPSEWLSRLEQCRSAVSMWRPDLVLIDRCLQLGGRLCESLSIPYIAIGTPGGDWTPSSRGKFPGHMSGEIVLSSRQAAKASIRWITGEVKSCWVNSPHLNVTFLGRSFYPEACLRPHLSAQVCLFRESVEASSRTTIGVSFGNTKNTTRLEACLPALLDWWARNHQAGAILFAGRNENLRARLAELTRDSSHEVRGWSDLTQDFHQLRLLAYFGGVGTLWLCLQYDLPSLIFPQGADQIYNAQQVARLGVGLDLSECDSHDLRGVQLSELPLGTMTDRIRELRSRAGFSDTLDSIVSRILTEFN